MKEQECIPPTIESERSYQGGKNHQSKQNADRGKKGSLTFTESIEFTHPVTTDQEWTYDKETMAISPYHLQEEKEKSLGSDKMRQIEKFVLLQTIDSKWKDHLLNCIREFLTKLKELVLSLQEGSLILMNSQNWRNWDARVR